VAFAFHGARARAEAKPINLSVASLNLALAGALDVAGRLAGSGCLDADPELQNKVVAYSRAGSTFRSLSSLEVASLLAAVQRPMQGNGRCDGGFDSVSTETQTRIERTAQSLRAVVGQHLDFLRGIQPVIELPAFFSGKSGCVDRINGFLDKLNDASKAASDAAAALENSINDVKARLVSYKATNANLGASCGRMPSDSDQNLLATLHGGAGNAKVRGMFQNPSSTITGDTDEKGLAAGEPASLIAGSRAAPEHAAGSLTGSSSRSKAGTPGSSAGLGSGTSGLGSQLRSPVSSSGEATETTMAGADASPFARGLDFPAGAEGEGGSAAHEGGAMPVQHPGLPKAAILDNDVPLQNEDKSRFLRDIAEAEAGSAEKTNHEGTLFEIVSRRYRILSNGLQ
jgi:hypothetical protein